MAVCRMEFDYYMAVLSSADQEQYEAAMVDGAGKIKQAIHITLPIMLPTIAINLIISLGNILNIGFEKVLLMYTPTTYETADIFRRLYIVLVLWVLITVMVLQLDYSRE